MTILDLMEQEGTPGAATPEKRRPQNTLEIPAELGARPVQDGRSLFDRAVCLLVEMRRLGTRRKVAPGDVSAGTADVDMIHVSKDVLQAKTLDAINRADGEIRRYLERRTSGPALFRTGVYMLSLDLLAEVDGKLEAYMNDDRPMLVQAFIAEYEAAKADAKRRLGTLYNPADYPPAEQVRATFGMRTQYIALSAPGTLADFRADIWQREQQKAQKQWSEALEECRQVLRAEALDLVTHMAERLEPTADGKPKVFRDSLVRNMDEFLGTFSARNIADDAELGALMEKVRGMLRGVRPDDLRKQDGLRAAVAREMANVKAALTPLVGGRAFFQEEE